jgi:hypothetical protein
VSGSEVESERRSLDGLLELQEHDSAIDRLRHRRETLPERGVLRAAEATLAELTGRIDVLAGRRDEVGREEQRYDDEARSLEEKAAEVERKMYSGEIASPRELQAMQADVDQLRRHRRGVEDRELAVMEQREAFDREIGALETGATERRAEADRARQSLAEQEGAIDAELGVETAARDELAGATPDELLAEYERCRQRARGIGAARLVGGTCQGCHLSIPTIEAERIRRAPPGTVAHCDNCGCILVP